MKLKKLFTIISLLYAGMLCLSAPAYALRLEIGQGDDTLIRARKSMVSIDVIEPNEYAKYADQFRKISEEEKNNDSGAEDIFSDFAGHTADVKEREEIWALFIVKDINENIIAAAALYRPSRISSLNYSKAVKILIAVRHRYQGMGMGKQLTVGYLKWMAQNAGGGGYNICAALIEKNNKASLMAFKNAAYDLGLVFETRPATIPMSMGGRYTEGRYHLIRFKYNTAGNLGERLNKDRNIISKNL
jgi:hypothetical protein